MGNVIKVARELKYLKIQRSILVDLMTSIRAA
jgi:hypothetical protein